jgi:(S)-2-hydroxyglutarate dehydrogenase
MNHSNNKTETDVLIIGGGIIGLTIAREISTRWANLKLTLIEKESSLAAHASGRNSGVLHAGFYYSPDSLKAKFTVEGNRLLTDYCIKHKIKINPCGKVVVAKNEKEFELLHELKQRGDKNGVDLRMIDEKELSKLEPNARTCKAALYSPTTSTVKPTEIVEHIAGSLESKVNILLNEKFEKRIEIDSVMTNRRKIDFKFLVNAAGLYADKVAQQFGNGNKYTVIPFKGLYMIYNDPNLIGKHIYPVPELRNPFLGVHFTKTVDGRVKIGPTAIPAFWRENYKGMANFKIDELMKTLFYETRLFVSNSFNFRNLAFEEIKKYFGRYMIDKASLLVKEIDKNKFGGFLQPGIRAQLLNKEELTLVMDFVVEYGENSAHILNAVSPAFTCSFSFARFIVDEIQERWAV